MAPVSVLELVLDNVCRHRTGRGAEERLELAAVAHLVGEGAAAAAAEHGGHQALLAVLLLPLQLLALLVRRRRAGVLLLLLLLLLLWWDVAAHVRVRAGRSGRVCRGAVGRVCRLCGGWPLVGVGVLPVGCKVRRGRILLLLWCPVLSLLGVATALAVILCRGHGLFVDMNVTILLGCSMCPKVFAYRQVQDSVG